MNGSVMRITHAPYKLAQKDKEQGQRVQCSVMHGNIWAPLHQPYIWQDLWMT